MDRKLISGKSFVAANLKEAIMAVVKFEFLAVNICFQFIRR